MKNGGTDNWSIVQDKRGVMYFGNSTGILEYDGVNWRMASLSNESIVRSLAVDSTGRIYAGGVGDFGYLAPDIHGNSAFVSLAKKLPESEKDFGDVAKVYCTQEGVYFTSFKKLYCYYLGKLSSWEPENSFHFSFYVKRKFYIMERGVGLKVMDHGALKHVPGSSFLAEDRVYAMVPFGNRILLSARENGLFLFNPAERDSLKAFTKFNTTAESYLLENQVYHGVLVNDTTVAFATLRGGVCFVGASGNYMKVLNKKNGLGDDNIKYLCKDRQDGLWMAMDNGISRAEINSPLLYYSDLSGLKGSVQDVLRFENRLYVAGTAGLFISSDNASSCFTPYAGISSQVRDLLTFDGSLIAATGEGVMVIGKNGPELIGEYNAFKIYRSVTDPSRLFIGTSNGIASLKKTASGWKDEGMLEGIDQEINTIGEEKNGALFVSTRTQGIRYIQRDPNASEAWPAGTKIVNIDASKGLSDSRFNFIFDYKGSLVFTTLKGIYIFDNASQKLIPDARFKDLSVNGTCEIFSFIPQGDDKIWMSTANELIKETGIAILKNANFEWFSRPFKHFSESEIHCIFPEDNIVWIGGPDGLISYTTADKNEHKAEFAPLFRKITMGKDSIYFMGSFNGEMRDGKLFFYNGKVSGIPEFDFKHNSIELEFSAPAFDNERKNVFRWFLEGYDKKWTVWTRESKTQYTNLPEGSYTLHLQAKDIYDDHSIESIFVFEILPPWYRTIYAYIFYVLAFLGLVYGVVQISIRRLKKAKIVLEHMVQERTAEVVKQKEEIETQKLVVDQKNKDITDSINYASRIQQAILPVEDELKDVLPGLFVVFKPRDIVSGDFYWFYRKGNDVLIAAADCTGHGVPGAFMSMIGHTLLNDIVTELDVPHPDLILNELNVRIRSALKQDQQNENRDGMDIALCRINVVSKELEYAAAMRPLYLVREQKLEEVKADKFPIGGLQDGLDKIFTRHRFNLNNGDGFYVASDGYADQFGGSEGKKFMTRKFKDLLQDIFPLSSEEQHRRLLASFLGWKGEHEQVDDILVIGVRV